METLCVTCNEATKYVCIQCGTSTCNRCSKYETDEEMKGWVVGKSVGYCLDCSIVISADNDRNIEELFSKHAKPMPVKNIKPNKNSCQLPKGSTGTNITIGTTRLVLKSIICVSY